MLCRVSLWWWMEELHQYFSGLLYQHWGNHDDVMKWKNFLRYWPFVQGIHRSMVNSPHKGQWCGALMFSLICIWINGWENNREPGDLRRHPTHYDVIVMLYYCPSACKLIEAVWHINMCQGTTLASWIVEHIEIKEQSTKFVEKLIVKHQFYTITTNKRTPGIFLTA